MTEHDLAELDTLLASARAVVPMRDIWAGNTDPAVIGLRHDVDDNVGSLDTAVRIAGWEHARGYRSTFFMLHTAHYWDSLQGPLERIAGYGHEIGIHTNAVTVALTVGGDPADILAAAIDQLRGWGHEIVGVAPHGDELCHTAGFINDEIFTECARPDMGAPDRWLNHDGHHVRLQPRPLAHWRLGYETYRLPRGRYLSDSGGTWNIPPRDIGHRGQLHILWHPDWWGNAL